jgi:hypothetical protein
LQRRLASADFCRCLRLAYDEFPDPDAAGLNCEKKREEKSMKYHIEQHGNEVVISFDAMDSQAQVMIEAIGRCRQSARACSSGECMKIADMETCSADGAMAVRLKPHSDATLSMVSLGECLKYQMPKDVRA